MRCGLTRAAVSVSAIRNSSRLRPDWSAAASHRGRLPRPDHVSSGAKGLKYLGRTSGYLRRGRLIFGADPGATPICSVRFSCASRLSSSSFSMAIFSERIFVSSSCKSQSSSKSIPSRFNFRFNLPIANSSISIRKQSHPKAELLRLTGTKDENGTTTRSLIQHK